MRVCAGVMERVEAMVPALAFARGVTPGSVRSPFLSTASSAAPPLLPAALGAGCPSPSRSPALLLVPRPRGWRAGEAAAGDASRLGESPSGSGRLTPALLQPRAAVVEADPCWSDKLLLSWLRRGAVTPSPGWPNLLGVPE